MVQIHWLLLNMLSKFETDLLEGQGLEDFILWMLHKKYPKSHRIEGSFKYFDINIPENGNKLECKYDRLSRQTSNIAIEFMDRGKPSGIASTKATHWVYCFWDGDWRFAFMQIQTIKELIDGAKIVNGGDNLEAQMYLLPKRLLYKNEDVIIRKFKKEFKEFQTSRASVKRTLGS